MAAPPSFSSFPAFNSVPDLDASSTGQQAEKRKLKEAHQEAEIVVHGASGRERERRKDRKHSRKDRKRVESDSRPFQDDERSKVELDRRTRRGDDDRRVTDDRPLFFSDRKGDPLNVQFGKLHAGDVPRYRLAGGGKKVLGLDSAWSVLHRNNRGVEIGIGTKRRVPSLTDSSSRRLLAAPPTRRLLATAENKYKFDEIEGFLRLPSSRDPLKDQSYRSITGGGRHSDSDSDTSASSARSLSGSSDSDSDVAPLTAHQQTLKELEQRLAADPSSLSAWFSLLARTLSTVPLSSKNAPQARAEIALSVLSRALQAHPSNVRSAPLRLKYLRAGEEVWHESKLRYEWEDALKIAGGADIWLEWLDWRLRKGGTGVESAVTDAKRAIASLGNDETGTLRVFWKVAVAFQQAGFVERASALFQAQAELIFALPAHLAGAPLETQLDALEEFWESETPRIGEESAKGWAVWLFSGRPEHVPAPVEIPRPHNELTNDPYRRWAANEAEADRTQQLPAHGDDDPYATILFSDVRPLLLPPLSASARRTFRLIWLAFLGLNLPGLYVSLGAGDDERWSATHLSAPAYLDAVFPSRDERRSITADAHAGVLIGREREYVRSGLEVPVKAWGLGCIGVFDGLPGKGKESGTMWMWRAEDVTSRDAGFVRRIFAGCRIIQDDEEWDSLALAFEAALSPKSAAKLSRSFLANAQNSLPRWAAHARLERLRGRIDDARKVYDNVLSASPTAPGSSVLWWDWAEMEWLASRADDALRVALKAVGVESASGVGILRARRALEDKIHSSAHTWEDGVAWVKIRALVDLLSSSVDAARVVLDASLNGDSASPVGTVVHESLTMAALLLLYHHGTTLRNAMPPGVLRDLVGRALDNYPNNTIILGIFLESERGQGVWGRVRGLLSESGDSLAPDKTVTRRVAEIWVAGWERGRWDGEKERIRSSLASAVQSDALRGSTVLWRVYLEFEIRAGELAKAKKLLFRAVGECPLCKELYLLAFGPLRAVFTGKELDTWAETMAERGLRMRTGLDEALEGWTGRDERGPEGDFDGEDEIEHNAEELRRLRPY